MRILTKDVTIGGQRYQLNLITPADASWIKNLLVSVVMKQMNASNQAQSPEQDAKQQTELAKLSREERAEGAVAIQWMMCASGLSEDVYKRVQRCALLSCRVYDQSGVTSLVMLPDGRWATKGLPVDLAQDGPAVDELIGEALKFSIAPFFIAAESKAEAANQAISEPIQSK
jgi:hypothetical protein